MGAILRGKRAMARRYGTIGRVWQVRNLGKCNQVKQRFFHEDVDVIKAETPVIYTTIDKF
jgi:hypothetical protein